MYKRVEICGVSTSSLPKKTPAEIEMMITRLKNGDYSVKDDFVKANLRLVLSIVQKFSSNKENIDDIFQIGCIGLLKAIDNFDLKYNVKFSTYAVPMIEGEIKRYLRDSGMIQISRSVKDVAYKALKVKEQMQNENLQNSQIAKILGIDTILVDEAMRAICEPCSLSETLYQSDNSEVCIMNQIKDEKNTEENWIENIALNQAFKYLSPKEKQIINMRYYKGITQSKVADKIGISQAQVSRIEKTALENIKSRLHG